MDTRDPIEWLRLSSHLDDHKWTLENGEVVTCFNVESIESNAINWGEQWRKIADDIEAAYMKLPVDADGVPIRVGDMVCFDGSQMEVMAVSDGSLWFDRHPYEVLLSCEDATSCRHVKPETVEGIIAEVYHLVREAEDECGLIADYAERIRKAVEHGN